jgi:hypothetical protein
MTELDRVPDDLDFCQVSLPLRSTHS